MSLMAYLSALGGLLQECYSYVFWYIFCLFIHIPVCLSSGLLMHEYKLTCICKLFAHLSKRAHTRAHTRTHTHTHTHARARTHAHTHAHTWRRSSQQERSQPAHVRTWHLLLHLDDLPLPMAPARGGRDLGDGICTVKSLDIVELRSGETSTPFVCEEVCIFDS